MQDNELTEILSNARRAAGRLDTARMELAFETRMQPVIRGTTQVLGPASRFHEWLRATIGLATAVGVLAFFFIAGRGAIESDDTLNAWWTDNSAVWDLELFN